MEKVQAARADLTTASIIPNPTLQLDSQFVPLPGAHPYSQNKQSAGPLQYDALVTFPMMMGLFAVAQDFVTVVFGEKWLPMLPVLKILCWVGMLQSIGTTVGTIYLATGQVNVAFKFLLVAAPVLVLAFIVGLPWGIVGVATAYAAASFGLFYVSLTIAFRIAGIRLRDFHAAIARPLLASVVMLVVVTVSAWILQQWGTEIGIGVLAYAGATLLLNKRQLRELLAITRAALSKSVPTQA